MRYKKYLSMIVVIVLLSTSLSAVALAKKTRVLNEDNIIRDTGTIKRLKISHCIVDDKGIYLIHGDRGTYFMGKLFKKYLPLNLPEEFKQHNLKVNFTATVVYKRLVSLIGIRYIFIFHALPIELIHIEKINDVEPENHPPEANFVFEPENPLVGEDVNFMDKSKDEDGSVVAWKWDFGDGFVSDEQNPVHMYNVAGLYKVTLTVVDDDGATGTVIKEVNVKGEEPVKPGVIAGVVREDPILPVFLFKPIPGAKIEVYTSGEIEPIYVTYTDERGLYKIEVEPGVYDVKASKPRYKTEMVKNVEVESDEEETVNFVLEKQCVALHFDIQLEKKEYKPGESINVTAILTNNDDHPVTVNIMKLEYGTLDFVLKTPDDKKIHYIGEIQGPPETIELQPGESLKEKVDLTKIELGYINHRTGEKIKYDLNTPGGYYIVGIYKIGISPYINEKWFDFLFSPMYKFRVIEE
ncbi:MAG: hypothetical protein DRN24_00030 [Thermoplasmata archaeon]|nr:MAG: hypothetical protein DRN24_00030 [Thermoplasmata archaeon]